MTFPSLRCALAILLLGVMATNADAQGWCVGLGFCDPPLPEPITFDLVLDGSDGSTATPEACSATARAILPGLAARPGSLLRVWWLGDSIETTELLMAVMIERPKRRARKYQVEWEKGVVAQILARLTTAAERRLRGKRGKRSPLAEGLTRIAWADVPTRERVILVISDLRQVGVGLGATDFECGRLPTADAWLAELNEDALLSRGILANARVTFAFASAPPIAANRCRVSMRREAAIRELWRVAITRAGAKSVTFLTGAPTSLLIEGGSE